MSDFTQKWLEKWGLTLREAGKALDVDERTVRNWRKKLPRTAEYAMRYLNHKWKGK